MWHKQLVLRNNNNNTSESKCAAAGEMFCQRCIAGRHQSLGSEVVSDQYYIRPWWQSDGLPPPWDPVGEPGPNTRTWPQVWESLWNQMVSVAATEWFLSECHCASGPHSPWPGILSWDPCETDWSAGGGQCVASGRGVPVCLPVYLSATLLCTCTHRLHPRSNTRPPISLLVSADHSGGKVVSTNPVSETLVMRGQW